MEKKAFIAVLLTLLILTGCPNPFEDLLPWQNDTDIENPSAESEELTLEFVLEEGEHEALTEITFNSSISSATIYYTTDGSDPSTDSSVYNSQSPPRLYSSITVKAFAESGDQRTDIISRSFTAVPRIEGFDFEFQSGLRWNYNYEHRRFVGYSWSGMQSFTSEKDFQILLGNEKVIDGVPCFELIVIGDFQLRWQYIGLIDHRILGSDDGETLTVLFDAMFGYWQGDGFFLDFSSSDIISVNSSQSFGSDYKISSGWSYSDDDTAYYPGVGTIYDPDRMSAFSDMNETFRADVGPAGYYKYSSYSDYYENYSNRYTITLTSTDSVEDYSLYSSDHTLSHSDWGDFTYEGGTDKIKVLLDSSMKYLVFVHFPTISFNPVISVLDRDFDYLVQDQNTPQQITFSRLEPLVFPKEIMTEVFITDYIDGYLYVHVEENSGVETPYRVIVMPIKSANKNAPLTIYGPDQSYYLDFGSWRTGNLSAGEVHSYQQLFTPFDSSRFYYFFAIPLDSQLDPALSTILFDPQGYYERVDMYGTGMPEVFYMIPGNVNCAVEVFDYDYDTPGDYVFGYGLY